MSYATPPRKQCRAREALGELTGDPKAQQCSLSQEEKMLAISQAAQGSPAAPMRDRAGNSVLQSNQLLPGECKAHLGGFAKPDSFSQSSSSTLLMAECCNTDLPGTSNNRAFSQLCLRNRAGEEVGEMRATQHWKNKNHSLFHLPPPRSGTVTHPAGNGSKLSTLGPSARRGFQKGLLMSHSNSADSKRISSLAAKGLCTATARCV